MDKNAIKKYAVWARRELIARVSQRAALYGITEQEIAADGDSINGHVLSSIEKQQRDALLKEIEDKGYEQVMEEVAYTWFNRFSALRFMEVNGYLPSHVRVFTDDDNAFKPQILAEAINMELDGLDLEKVYALKNANDEEALFKYLIIIQCNALNKILPGMFQTLSDYTELLFPDNLLREGSVIQQMIELIPEDDWKDAVQIIGWLYQYYNSEKKDDVFAALKKNVKITKENIPAATQLFTPDWIVRYMVENSLGRLWLEGYPDVKEQLLPTEEEQSAYATGNREPEDTKWHYYLEEAEQEPEVQAQLAEIRKEYAALTPDQLKVIDPCSGSGHILAYMFDVLMKIYESYGYTTREAVASIVENNLYGLDIDDRAAQLAYFAVMMKARQYDRRFFSRGIQPHVYAIEESNHVDKFAVDYFCNGDAKLTTAMDTIIKELHDAKEYGSILTVTPQDWSVLYDRFAEITEDINMSRETALRELLPLVQVAEALAQKYDVVVTNPPYMGASNMNPKLNDFIKKNYADYKSDFFSAFVIHCSEMTKKAGYCGFFTPYVWMFIQSYEKMRKYLYEQATIETLIQFEYSAFEEATVPVCTFAFQNRQVQKKGCYLRLVDFRGGMEVQRQRTLEAIENHNCGFYYEQSTDDFSKIPGSPVAYWLGHTIYDFYRSGNVLSAFISSQVGTTLGDNAQFMRLWYEVSKGYNSKWFFSHKGGSFRRWYGNVMHIINWENGGKAVKDNGRATVRGEMTAFNKGISWTQLTAGKPSFRVKEKGTFIESASCMCYIEEKYGDYLLGFLNSCVADVILDALNPTMHFQPGDIGRLPWRVNSDNENEIATLVQQNIDISHKDWDSFETSWDFKRNSLLIQGEGMFTLAGMKVGEKRWIEKLRNGSACFSPIGDFIKQGEASGNNEQGDMYEGVFAKLRKDDPRVEEMRVKLSTDLEEIIDGDYILLRRKSSRTIPVFCMYGFYKEDAEIVSQIERSDGNIECHLRFTTSQKMYDKFLNDGKNMDAHISAYGVGFSAGHMQREIERVLNEKNVEHQAVKVSYNIFDGDEEFFINPTDDYPELHHKAKRMSYQKEIRIILPKIHQEEKFIVDYSPLSSQSIGMFSGDVNYECDIIANERNNIKIAGMYHNWQAECEDRFQQLKKNEEELNRIFIDIYGLQDELPPDVEDKDVTVHRVFDSKDAVPESMKGSNYVRTMRDEIVSLLSYAVGCMFGRYSLDVDGLAYAGGEWDESKYTTFPADKDNIIPICDDEYFKDDIVGLFVEFVKIVYGEDTLEENLKFVADALGGKGSPRDVIRDYFIKDFYKDHCKTYQKRPIYWLFDSGKKNGFKALIYMHRYQPDTIARIRTDYVHEQQARYRTALEDLTNRMESASTGERVKLNKKHKKLQDQAEEIRLYEEKIHHLADQMISIDLDDGVKHNYAIFKDVLAKIK